MSEVLEETKTCWMNAENFLSVPHTEAEYDNAVALLNQLIDIVGENETHFLAGLMETLGILIETYENQHFPMPNVSGKEILIYLMEEHGLNASRLNNEIGTENEVLEVIN